MGVEGVRTMQREWNSIKKDVDKQRFEQVRQLIAIQEKGTIYAWDVVNEAISDKKDEYLFNSKWYQICGKEYIAKAFEYAHEADLDALLFYNDYNEISPVKREKIYKLVKGLKDAGVPIHGVGLQGHWAVNEPTEKELTNTIEKFANLGLKVQITELDVSVYPKEHDARERKPDDANTAFTAEKEQKQIEMYKMYFRVFRKR